MKVNWVEQYHFQNGRQNPLKPLSSSICEFQKNPPELTMFALARPFCVQMSSNLLYLNHESLYFAKIAHIYLFSLIWGLKFWFKVKKCDFWDTQTIQHTMKQSTIVLKNKHENMDTIRWNLLMNNFTRNCGKRIW